MDLDFLIVNKRNGGIEILQRKMFDPCSPTQVWCVQAGNGARLPPKIFTHVFKIGGKYAGKMMAHMSGLHAGFSGHYGITTSAMDACFGAWLPSTLTTYPLEKATGDVGPAVKVDAKPSIKKLLKPRGGKKHAKDLIVALGVPVDARLNMTR